MQAVREEALRDALSKKQDPAPSVILDVDIDPFAKNRVSFTGLDCRIIGTFYEDSRDGKVVLEFGHDVDNFYATVTYRVFKPVGDGLSAIVSYIKPTEDPVEMVRIGAVRYSSTRRRTAIAKQDDIPVEVNVYDFIGNKTGMFGMTRMGKSNTMKTVAARVFAVSERRRAAGQPNARDFRYFRLFGVLWSSCPVFVLVPVFPVVLAVSGHGGCPRAAAGLARGSTVRVPGGRAVPPS